MPVTADATATLQLAGGASLSVPPGATTGPGRLVGSVLAAPPAPRLGVPVGDAYDFHLDGAQLTGPATLSLPAPALAAVDGDPGPDTALMAYYDQSAHDWAPVASTYDPAAHTVTAQTPHLSWWRVFRLDFGAVRAEATKELKTIFGTADTAPQPDCPGADQLKADGFVFGTDHAGIPILKSCAGVSDGHAQLRIADNRGYAMSVEYPDQWTATLDGADELDQALSAWMSQKIVVAPRGRKIAILPSGQTITLTALGRQNPVVHVTAEGQAYLASALLYGVETLAMVLGKIPGAKTPEPSVLAKAFIASMDSKDCIASGIALTHTNPTTADGVADLFVKDYELAFGCLKDQWEVAYGVGAGVTAFVAGVGIWLVKGVVLARDGITGAVDSIRYFGGVRFSVEGPGAGGSGALTYGSWRGATVGMPEPQVQAAVGPQPVQQLGGCDLLGKTTASGTPTGPLYTVDRSTGHLIGIQPPTTVKTAGGIGTGATVAQVKKAYPQLTWALGDEGLEWVGVAIDPAHTDRALGFQFTGATNQGVLNGTSTAQGSPPTDDQTVTTILAGTPDYVSLFEVCSG